MLRNIISEPSRNYSKSSQKVLIIKQLFFKIIFIIMRIYISFRNCVRLFLDAMTLSFLLLEWNVIMASGVMQILMFE